MSWYKCLLGSMPWCKCSCSACHDANVHLGVCHECKCPLVGISWHGMLWCKHNLFKNSFYFQNEASTTPEIKIFSKLDLLFLKSHLLFYLRLLKNWWLLLEILEWGIDLESDDRAQRFIFTIWLSTRGGTFQRLFLEKWILWKSSILKRFIFLVFEYGNLIGVKTHRDRLKIWERTSWTKGSNF